VKTSGAQTYNDAISLSAAVTLTSTASGNITFASSVNGAQTLTVTTAGATIFAGAVGGTAALDSLKQRLVALPARDEVPCRAAIDAVDTYRQRGGAPTPDQIDESLRTYAAFVSREAELAKQHAQRKDR